MGVKNPRYMISFCRYKRGRRRTCKHILVHSKRARVLFVLQHIGLFLNIIFVSYHINKCMQMAWWMMRWLVIIGTWVRIPGLPKYFLFFFLMYSSTRLAKEFIMYLTHQHAMWPQAWIPWSRVVDYHIPSQPAPWTISKVKQA